MKIAFIILIVACMGTLLCSCDDKLDIQQAYDFSLSTMPIQKRIKQNETAEIRCQLNKSGNYKEAEFRIGYFQFDGLGTLKMDDGTIFLPNDTYPLKKETFRLYYTSECTDQQQITIYVTDNQGQHYELEISFANDSDKEEPAE
ncbi:DUF3872 domain-containing protein [Bacteroides neonati]|uniref:DUF3872 domain-containing protein n=1 Tax=Bacteroides neonati TaxID=1347393 RepID=UPI0005A99B2B|nr:DUF3872 domain-containing protein [Bacteroides neonati]